MSKLGWFIILVAVACVAGVGIAGYVFYKYRLRVSPLVPDPWRFRASRGSGWIRELTGVSVLQSYMDSEIMSIMSQYMPLDSQNNENQPLRQHDSEALR
jgi:hypothetical protein